MKIWVSLCWLCKFMLLSLKERNTLKVPLFLFSAWLLSLLSLFLAAIWHDLRSRSFAPSAPLVQVFLLANDTLLVVPMSKKQHPSQHQDCCYGLISLWGQQVEKRKSLQASYGSSVVWNVRRKMSILNHMLCKLHVAI